ncbi:uncharacterized protein LOC117291528 isoform X2 [Asterias rubens]|uniref:uncharacterized protein LOC117291528 isoform X2 n=1 Tax=Asterias rubens TaxID=7604 RepID=UPI0014557661|nr:uncharacterized protein LOC117291528 isoform X2 [Asterias rubens]
MASSSESQQYQAKKDEDFPPLERFYDSSKNKRKQSRIQGASWQTASVTSQGRGGSTGSRIGPKQPHQSGSSSREDYNQQRSGRGGDLGHQPSSGRDQQPQSGRRGGQEQQTQTGRGGGHEQQTHDRGGGHEQQTHGRGGGHEQQTHGRGGGHKQQTQSGRGGGHEQQTHDRGGGHEQQTHDRGGGHEQQTHGRGGGHKQQTQSGRGGGHEQQTHDRGGGHEQQTHDRGGGHEQQTHGRGGGHKQQTQSGRGRGRGRGIWQQDQSDRGRKYDEQPPRFRGAKNADNQHPKSSGVWNDEQPPRFRGAKNADNQHPKPGGVWNDDQRRPNSARGGGYNQQSKSTKRCGVPQQVQFGRRGRGPRQFTDRPQFTYETPTEHIVIPTKAKERVIVENGRHILSEGPSGQSVVELMFDFLTKEEADRIFEILDKEIDWYQQTNTNRYGDDYKEPRQVCWYGEHPYAYSKVQMKANQKWPHELLEVRKRIEAKAGMTFNSVLCNKYRNQHDGVAWHSDDEYGLRDQPTIASLSLGEERMFEMRKKPLDRRSRDYTNCEKLKVPLTHGSFLIMSKHTQDDWQHQVPKESKPKTLRINLTFRNIYPDERFEKIETKAPPGGKESSSLERTEASSMEEENKAPFSRGGTEASSMEEESKAPLSRDGTEASSMEEENKAPFSRDETEASLKEEESTAPFSWDGTEAALKEEEKKAPLSLEDSEACTMEEESKAPFSRDGTEASSKEEENQAPSNWEDLEASTMEEESKAPSSYEGTSAPSKEEETNALIGSAGNATSSKKTKKESRQNKKKIANQEDCEASTMEEESKAQSSHEGTSAPSKEEETNARIGSAGNATSSKKTKKESRQNKIKKPKHR